jgi:hypothetical protein
METDDPERFGPGDVEHARDERDGRVIDVPELMLEIVEDRNRRTRRRALSLDQGAGNLEVEHPRGGHRCFSLNSCPGRSIPC